MQTEKKVLSFEKTSAKPGAWTKLKTEDDKGQRDMYIKTEALAALITKAGYYNFTLEKNGKYWEPTAVQFVRPLDNAQPSQAAPAAPSTNGAAKTYAPRDPMVADINVLIQNRSITSQVCVKSAADIIVAALNNGAFKGKELGGLVDVNEAAAAAASLAVAFMGEVRTWMERKADTPEPTPNPLAGKSYKDEDGRTHEKVEGA